MATKYIDIKGRCKWAKVWKPDQKYKKYSIDLCPDAESKELLKTLGLQNKYKMVEGEEYITFRRDPNQSVFKGDDRVPAGAPQVLGVDPNVDIGNGSDVTVRIAVYSYDNSYGKGTGSRLEKVMVNNLVEYKPNETSLDSPF